MRRPRMHLQGGGLLSVDHLLDILRGGLSARRAVGELEPLVLAPGTKLTDRRDGRDSRRRGARWASTSARQARIWCSRGGTATLVDFQYLRTAGNPEAAVRKGLQTLQQKYGAIRFAAVGVTGSGRERIGRMIGADAIRDEITAQAKGATFWVPGCGYRVRNRWAGQQIYRPARRRGCRFPDEQNLRGRNGLVCRGAGRAHGHSHRAVRPLALTAKAPAALGERCTVFIETAIASAAAESVGQAEIAAGLCHAHRPQSICTRLSQGSPSANTSCYRAA